MAIEIEKKFLVYKDRLPDLINGEHIIQGYLSLNPQIRFRFQKNMLVVAIKKLYENGSRFEVETKKVDVSEDEKKQLLQMALFPAIEKIRYRIPYEGLIWEIDVYQAENQGLITADVELPRFDYTIHFPRWIDGKHDISADSRYFNLNLGKKPFSQWK